MATSSALGSSNSTYYIIFARPCSNRGGVDGGNGDGGISSRSSLGSTSPFPLPLSLSFCLAAAAVELAAAAAHTHRRPSERASGGTKEGVEERERHEAASSNFFWGNTGGGGYTVSEGGRERESPGRPTAERAPPISRPPPSPPKQREASARAPLRRRPLRPQRPD